MLAFETIVYLDVEKGQQRLDAQDGLKTGDDAWKALAESPGAHCTKLEPQVRRRSWEQWLDRVHFRRQDRSGWQLAADMQEKIHGSLRAD